MEKRSVKETNIFCLICDSTFPFTFDLINYGLLVKGASNVDASNINIRITDTAMINNENGMYVDGKIYVLDTPTGLTQSESKYPTMLSDETFRKKKHSNKI